MPMRSRWLLAAVALLGPAISHAGETQVSFERIKLDDTFRSEGVAVGDFNKDGKLDVAAGEVWYQAPDWKMHEFRPVKTYDGSKGYSNSFADFAWDVNSDGWDDIIVIGFPGAPYHWYENPQGKEGHWTEHMIWHSACNESPEFEDLNGDGKPEVIVGSQPEKQLGFNPLPATENAAQKWDFIAVSEPGDPGRNGSHHYYHGLGVGDVNQDGRADVLIPHGWYEAPENPMSSPWTFHEWKLHKTGEGNPPPAANMYVDDFDLDGDQDVVMSSAHNFGIWWWEAVPGENGTDYKYHLIDESYSQTHAMEYVDMNGDGQKDLVTGKRFYAHQGNDPGGKDPVVMNWYEVKKQKGQPPQFIKHEIEAGKDTGVGTQFIVRDINGDKLPDIILSNKKGVNILVQKRN